MDFGLLNLNHDIFFVTVHYIFSLCREPKMPETAKRGDRCDRTVTPFPWPGVVQVKSEK